MKRTLTKLFCDQKLQICLVSLGLSTSSLLAATPSKQSKSAQKEEKPPYDADLFNKDQSVVFATGEFLYWKVNESALDYAIKMNQAAWSSTDTFAVGNYHNAKFDWAPGLRIAVGWFNAPHYWDVYLQYTFLPANGKNKVHAPGKEGEFLNGTWAQPDLDTGAVPLNKANSNISLKYHTLDLLFSRRFHTNNHLRINVFGGIASAFVYQNWKISYTDVLDQQSKLHTHWHFEGVGLRLGAKIDWFLGADFYLTGLASSGILSGWYTNKIRQTTTAVVSGGDNSLPIRDTSFHDQRLTYTAQFLAGPSWQKAYEKMRVELFAGYEFTIWTNLHEVFRSSQGAATATKETFINNSNVSLQGLTIRLNVDF